MIQTKITGLDKLKGFGAGSDDIFDRVRMEKLGQFARDTVVSRVRSGIGADGAPMPVLKGGNSRMFLARVNGKATFINQTYAARKVRAGLQGFRDLWGTGKQGGHMLDNLTVRQATANSVRIALTSLKQRQKALANEQRAPFLAFAPADVAAIRKQAETMFRDSIRAMRGNLPGLMRKMRGRAA